MAVTIQDNSAAWFREFDKRCNEALDEIGDEIMSNKDEIPVKTGATLKSLDKVVDTDRKSVTVGVSTEYAPLIRYPDGGSNPFLIRMLLRAASGIRRILNKEGVGASVSSTGQNATLPGSIQDIKGYRPPSGD